MKHRPTFVATGILVLAFLAGCGGEATSDSGSSSSSSGDASSPAVEAFCERLAPLADLGGQLQLPDVDLADLADQLGELAAGAPTAVKPSVDTIAAALATMASAAEASGEEGAAANAAAFAAIEGEIEALDRASSTVEGYASRECGFNLSGNAETPAGP